MVSKDKAKSIQQPKASHEEEKGVRVIKYTMLAIGSVSFLIGLIRQWPTLGKGYIAFIEGKGYMAFIMGIIIIILGLSVKLFIIDDFSDEQDTSLDTNIKGNKKN